MIISELNKVKAVKFGDVDIKKVYSGKYKVFPEEGGYFYIFHESDNTVTAHNFSKNLSTDIFKNLVNPNQFYFGFNAITILDYSEIENKTGSEIYNLFGDIARAKLAKKSQIIEKNKVYFVCEESKDYNQITVRGGKLLSCIKNNLLRSVGMYVNDEQQSCHTVKSFTVTAPDGTTYRHTTEELFNVSGYLFLNNATQIEKNKTYIVTPYIVTSDYATIEYSQRSVVVDDNDNVIVT